MPVQKKSGNLLNLLETYVAYAGIKANTRIQLFEVEPQIPKVSQFQFQPH